MIQDYWNLFNELYDKYCGMLYSIALDISQNETEAKHILMGTFQKAMLQKLTVHASPSCLITLIKLIIQTAHEYNGEPKNNFKIKQFENTPLLHQFLCEQIEAGNYCFDNNLPWPGFGKLIREEINSLHNRKTIEM